MMMNARYNTNAIKPAQYFAIAYSLSFSGSLAFTLYISKLLAKALTLFYYYPAHSLKTIKTAAEAGIYANCKAMATNCKTAT